MPIKITKDYVRDSYGEQTMLVEYNQVISNRFFDGSVYLNELWKSADSAISSYILPYREPMEQRVQSRARSCFVESRQRSTIGQGLDRWSFFFSSFICAKKMNGTFFVSFFEERIYHLYKT